MFKQIKRWQVAVPSVLVAAMLLSTAVTARESIQGASFDPESSIPARMERLLVDLRQKDCSGKLGYVPELLEPSDFQIIATDLHTQLKMPVPVTILGYDFEVGIAEISFPLEMGKSYRITTNL